MSDKLFNVHVIWRGDEDNFFCTLLQFEESVTQRQQLQVWSTEDYVVQAHEVEYPDGPNAILEGESYECIAVFEGDIRYIE